MQAVLDLILIAYWCIVGWFSQFDTFLECQASKKANKKHCRTENTAPFCLTSSYRDDHGNKSMDFLALHHKFNSH